DAVERIGHLEPHPGRAFLPNNQQYVTPEVFVTDTGKRRTPELAIEIRNHLEEVIVTTDPYISGVMNDAVTSLREQYDYDRAQEVLKRLSEISMLDGEQRAVVKACLAMVRDNELTISTNNDQVPHLRISN